MAKTLALEAIITAVDRFTKPMKSMTEKTRNIGLGLTAGLTLPIVGVGIAALKASTDFNAAMANVATLIPGNSERVEELKKDVQALAIETGKSTGDLADGLYQVISAFGDSAESTKLLGITARAATAGLATTTDALNLTSAVTKGYGNVTAEGVQHASDLAFMAVKLGQTTFPELAGALGRVIPLTAELGVSQEELFGVMATATGVTGKADEVTTQLLGIMQSLLSPTKEMSKLFEALGYESGKAFLAQEGLQGTLNKIVKAANLAKMPLQDFIGSIRGQTLALALTGGQSETFTQKLKAMEDVTGATDEAFREQAEGINKTGFTMAQLMQKVAVATQRLGDGLAPTLAIVMDKAMPLIDLIVDLAGQFSQLDPTLQTSIVVVGAVAAALGPLLVLISALIPAIALLAGPVGIAVGAFLGLSAVAGILYAKWEPIKTFFLGIGETIAGVIEKVQSVTSLASTVGSFFGFGSPASGGTAGGPGANNERSVEGVPVPGVTAAIPSVLPDGGTNTLNGAIKVQFENAPPGTRVTSAKTNQRDVDVETDVGFSLLGFSFGG